jgi:hypothetical protein
MTFILFALVLGATCHFVYESILAPSFRLKLRFDLFALRDELRRLKIERDSGLNDEHFEYLQGSLNTLISVLYRFDFATLNAVERETRRDPEVKARIERRVRVLDDCIVVECQSIRSRTLRIAVMALGVNNGVACLYLLPIFLCATGLSQLKRIIKESLSLRAPEIARYAPAPEHQLASLA